VVTVQSGGRYRVPPWWPLKGSFARVIEAAGESLVHREGFLYLRLLLAHLSEEVVVEVVLLLVGLRCQEVRVQLVRQVVPLCHEHLVEFLSHVEVGGWSVRHCHHLDWQLRDVH
jgi:hypothetical protein